MDHKGEAFCQLVDFLHRRHAQWARNPSADHKLQRLHREVIRSYKIIEPGRLRGLLISVKAGEEIDFLAGDGFLFLKPHEERGPLLPVMSLKADLERLVLKIRLALFTFYEDEEPAAIGFRFETPEGPGLHNYHHGQMITSFSTARQDLPKVPAWLPTSQPALMMSARNPFSLFLGVLIGLYGLDVLEQEWSGQRFMQSLRGDIEELKHGCGAPV